MGAADSLSVCKDPKAEPPCCAALAKLPNTEPMVVLVVDVASFDDPAPSPFSCKAAGGVKLRGGLVVVSGVFSSGFESPKVKPPLEELPSALDEPIPNAIPPLAPNLNPEPAADWSDFLSSLEAVPNLKPSDELPNLNPDEAVVSLEVVSDEELPNGTPNLNPSDDEEDDSVKEPPNLKPTDPDPDVLSGAPNLKPPELEVEVPPDDKPKP